MSRVVKYAQEQDQIKTPDRCRGNINNVQIDMFYPGLEDVPGEIKSRFYLFSFATRVIGINGQHALGPTTLGFEGEEAVCRTYIQHTHALEISRYCELSQLCRAIVDAGRYYSVS